MSENGGKGSFWTELKERRVVRVAALYSIVGWGVFEASNTLTEVFPTLPPWTAQLVLVLVILGFPVALVLAWAGDLFEARFASERGRLAALTGDTERAIREYTYYLTVRYDPEPALQAAVDEVRSALAAISGG